MKPFFCFLLFISLLAMGDNSYKVSTVPNIKTKNNSYVTDPKHLLNDTTVANINAKLTKLENLTTDQIAIVVLPSIGDAVPKDFAVDLFARFKIGQKDRNNGLLILLVADQRRVEFETGYGLEAVLPDVVCKRIQTEHMVPYFKLNKYDLGLSEGITVTCNILGSPAFRNEFLSEKKKATLWNPLELAQTIAWAIAMPYWIFITIVFYVKRSRGSFEETFHAVSRTKQNKIVLRIATWRWLLIYLLIPILFYLYINYYLEEYPLTILFTGLYAILLIMFVDRKMRCIDAYKVSYKPGDYYDKYNNHIKYFDSWGIAAVFFPVPFLFTDWQNKLRLQNIRKHARNCTQCNAQMRGLDEKHEDEMLEKFQQLEEYIKSVDYDVWVCSSCRHYEALAYYTKDSKYTACSNCGTKSYYLKSDAEKVSATYSHAGKGEKHFECMYCKKKVMEEYDIPPLTNSSSSSGGNSSSSGGSFGGGSSGGGGSGSSW